MPTSLVRSITALAPARRRTVLVIGNDREELAAWVGMLRDQGFDALGAEGGRAALRKAGETPPDVVVLDFRGRPASGVAAARHLRDRHGAAVKLLVASATSAIVLAQCLADYDAFIARPFKPAQLLRAIRGLFVEPSTEVSAPMEPIEPIERLARP